MDSRQKSYKQMDEYNVNLSVQFSPDNKLVATASGEGHTQLKVWNNGTPTKWVKFFVTWKMKFIQILLTLHSAFKLTTKSKYAMNLGSSNPNLTTRSERLKRLTGH